MYALNVLALLHNGDLRRQYPGLLIRIGFFALAAFLIGCSTGPTTTYGPGISFGGSQSYASVPLQGMAKEMEADGLPAQAPPLRRAQSYPDDQREPFSPNYGPPPWRIQTR